MDINLSEKEKEKIGKLILDKFRKSGLPSQARFAKSIGMDPADISNLRGDKWKENPQLIGAQKWLKLAKITGFIMDDKDSWVTADTWVKQFIDKQLTYCKNYSMTNILVDEAGIGKTYSCKKYAANNPNVFYIDCSNCSNKNRFIITLASTVGIDASGKYDDIFSDLINILTMTIKPLIILDEAGDLQDKALLEFKRLYNALEDKCGFYFVGSDGLRAKIERGIRCRKVGYKEIFSRFGKKYSRATDPNLDIYVKDLKEMALQVLEANGVTEKEKKDEIMLSLVSNGIKDLRTVKREVRKYRIEQFPGTSFIAPEPVIEEKETPHPMAFICGKMITKYNKRNK